MTPKVSNRHGQTVIGGLNRVFHCNFYNAYLQTAVLLSDGIGELQPRRLLADAVVPLVRRLKQQGYTVEDLIEEFAFCGFGKLQKLSEEKWMTPSSHYGEAALMQWRRENSCFFPAGYIAGTTEMETEETTCKQMNAGVDWFRVHPEALHEIPDYLVHEQELMPPPPRFGFPDAQEFSTAVDEDAIIRAVSQLPLYGSISGDGTGLIHAFGVVLTNHFADYYNRITYETYFGMRQAGVPKEQAQEVFVQGGHVCAFRTFGGIMKSPEWDQAIKPMCRDREDWIHAMVAVVNALGWGTWRVERIEPGRELVIRMYNSYEGVGYRRMYPVAEEIDLSFLGMGGVQGLAHLLYKIDIREKPELTTPYYTEVFNSSENRFQVTQTHAIAAGHDYDRIVARRE